MLQTWGQTEKGITLIKIKPKQQTMAWLFSFWLEWHLARITNRPSYCKTNPTSYGVQLECSMTNTLGGGGVLICICFSVFFTWQDSCIFCCSHVQLIMTMKSHAAIQRQPLNTSMITIMWLWFRRHSDQRRDTENWNIMWIYNKNMQKERKIKTWTSTADGVLMRTDETFCSDWPAAGRGCPFSERLASISHLSRW